MKIQLIDGDVTDVTPERWAAFEKFEADQVKAWPQNGDDYYCIDTNGQVLGATFSELMPPYHEYRQSIGNIYRSESEALAQVEKLKAKARIDKYIADNGLGFVPDWGDITKFKHYIAFSHRVNSPQPAESTYFESPTTWHFESEAHAQQVIDNCTDDLKTLFGVK